MSSLRSVDPYPRPFGYRPPLTYVWWFLHLRDADLIAELNQRRSIESRRQRPAPVCCVEALAAAAVDQFAWLQEGMQLIELFDLRGAYPARQVLRT